MFQVCRENVTVSHFTFPIIVYDVLYIADILSKYNHFIRDLKRTFGKDSKSGAMKNKTSKSNPEEITPASCNRKQTNKLRVIFDLANKIV